MNIQIYIHTCIACITCMYVCILKASFKFNNILFCLILFLAKIFNLCRETAQVTKGKSFLWYFLFAPSYNITTAEDAEPIFESTAIITKHVIYDLVRPFLGDGLLVSTGRSRILLVIF